MLLRSLGQQDLLVKEMATHYFWVLQSGRFHGQKSLVGTVHRVANSWTQLVTKQLQQQQVYLHLQMGCFASHLWWRQGMQRCWSGTILSKVPEREIWGHHMNLGNFRRWWGTGRPGVLQSIGLQRFVHDWATEQQQPGPSTPSLYKPQFPSVYKGSKKSIHLVAFVWSPMPRHTANAKNTILCVC